MWVIAGLGNYPSKYTGTRHNVGFTVIEALALRHGLEAQDKKYYTVYRGFIGDVKAALIKPLTYMNLSGKAVGEFIRRSNATAQTLIAVHDDIDLPTGRLRLRDGGASGGHRGIDSIIEHIGTRRFIRLKIGVGRDPLIPAEQYVLKKFRPDEKPVIAEAVERAADAVQAVLKDGLQEAMNTFNRAETDSPL